MEKINWMFIIFGVLLIIAASFGANPSLSPGNSMNPTDFQVLIGMGGLAAVIVGIIKAF